MISALSLLYAQAVSSQKTSDAASVRQFVQSFYDWYAPRPHKAWLEDQPVPSLGAKNAMFSGELQTLMREDLAAERRMTLLHVGLYPDPFLLWLSPPRHYSVKSVDQKEGGWLVKVVGDVPSGQPVPVVIVKLKLTNRGLVFTNFITDERDNFLNNLRNLHDNLANIQDYIRGALRPGSAADLASVRRFTQRFYSWYANEVADMDRNRNIDPEGDVLTKKQKMLAPQLYRLLWDDWDAQQHTSGYIVGIDFDPFLSSQDPNRYYKVHRIEHRANSWYVAVSGVPSRDEDNVSQVIAVVERIPGGWRFTNFIYDLGADLIEILKETKEDRRKHPIPRDKS